MEAALFSKIRIKIYMHKCNHWNSSKLEYWLAKLEKKKKNSYLKQKLQNLLREKIHIRTQIIIPLETFSKWEGTRETEEIRGTQVKP